MQNISFKKIQQRVVQTISILNWKEMPKLSADKLTSGMKLTKPVLNKAGMILLTEGTELTDSWIRRIRDMDLNSIHVDGPDLDKITKQELLAQLDRRFEYVENKPHMAFLKRVLKEHIESLYE
jgi:hypothetical protein